MARKKANYPLIESLEITNIAAEGKSMGRYNDIVVFVPMTVPGDVVDVQIRSKRRRFMEGYVVDYKVKSPLREEPFCEHFGVCGGCKWQHLPYSRQLSYKQEQVYDQLVRLGKLTLPEITPIKGSEKTSFYRNKLEYTFAPKRWMTQEEISSEAEISEPKALGFHIPGMFDKILDIKTCHLQADPSNKIRLEVRNFCIENDYSFHNVREHSGLMRNIIIRTSSTGEIMVIVIFHENDTDKINILMNHLQTTFPEITSLMYMVNEKLNDSVGDQTPILFSGQDYIFEQMEGLKFKIGPKSFYQTNSEQAYELYKVTRDFASLTGSETVYDLYTGTGTIANFVAKYCKKVIGVEYVPEAIEDAKVNSKINNIDNTIFFAGDMKDVLSDDFIAEHGAADVIILDPPRAGIHESVAETVLRAEPKIIVYVSCNPATQARDLALMAGEYKITDVQPVDMFPHTHHVENVVRLERI
ncbi:MAG: 23S rRNA (uracil(1939)-C(5))-methyltransferase RlmD [Rikenellaceae bacterium]